ncbi:hypothetical protein D3C79_931330 [compost metagenome]
MKAKNNEAEINAIFEFGPNKIKAKNRRKTMPPIKARPFERVSINSFIHICFIEMMPILDSNCSIYPVYIIDDK